MRLALYNELTRLGTPIKLDHIPRQVSCVSNDCHLAYHTDMFHDIERNVFLPEPFSC